MAANIQKAANSLGYEIKIIARSESDIESYIDKIEALMIGPNLKHLADDLSSRINGKNVKIILMRPDYYAVLDG